MNLAADPINNPLPQFVHLGIYTINALDKGASIWTPANIVRRPMDVTHYSAPIRIFGKTKAVEDTVSEKSDYNYKIDYENWREIQEFEHQNNARSQTPLYLTPVGGKMSEPKTLTQTTDLSKRK